MLETVRFNGQVEVVGTEDVHLKVATWCSASAQPPIRQAPPQASRGL